MSTRLRQDLAFALGVAAFGGLCLLLALVGDREDVEELRLRGAVEMVGMLPYLGACWSLGEWRTRQLAARAASPDLAQGGAANPQAAMRLPRWEWLAIVVAQLVVFNLRHLPALWIGDWHAYFYGFRRYPGDLPLAMILLTLLVALRLPQLGLSQGRVWAFALLVVSLWWRFPTDDFGLSLGADFGRGTSLDDQMGMLIAFWLLPVLILGARGGILAILGYILLVLVPILPVHWWIDWRLAIDYVPKMMMMGGIVYLLVIPWIGRAPSRRRILCEVGAGMLALMFVLQNGGGKGFSRLLESMLFCLQRGGWYILYPLLLVSLGVLLVAMLLIKQNVTGPTGAMIVLILIWFTLNSFWALTLATLMIALTMSPLAWGIFFAFSFFHERNWDDVKLSMLEVGILTSLLPMLFGRWRIGRQSDVRRSMPRSLDVLIATRNEAANIEAAIAAVREADGRAADAEALGEGAPTCRILVIDGGSTDDTVARAKAMGVEVLRASRLGRGNQFAEGLVATSGDLVLFLHADAQLEPDAIAKLARAFQANPSLAWGVLGQRFAKPTRHLRWIAFQGWLRWVFTGLAFGDQGQFVRRDLIQGPDAVDAYPAQPLLEDVELSLRLQPLVARAWIGAPMLSSPRAWERGTPGSSSLRNFSLIMYYLIWRRLGDSPAELAEKVYQAYYEHPSDPAARVEA